MLEKRIRTFLLKTMGLQGYLALVSDAYIRLIRLGIFRQKYPELFYLEKLVTKGNVCVDIGANVGYYSVQLSRLVGKEGRVHAIEPVPLFANIFLRNTKKFALNNITLHQTALGGENKKIQMGTPVIDGVFRHGLTRVLDENAKDNLQTFEAEMRIPDELFSGFDRIDFVKCDVEGYEVHLFPHMLNTLKKQKPVLQIEISSPENRRQLINMLKPLGYVAHGLVDSKLTKLEEPSVLNFSNSDFYFIPQQKRG